MGASFFKCFTTIRKTQSPRSWRLGVGSGDGEAGARRPDSAPRLSCRTFSADSRLGPGLETAMEVFLEI